MEFIYVIDASHENITDLEDLDPNISDIWLWNPKLNLTNLFRIPMFQLTLRADGLGGIKI